MLIYKNKYIETNKAVELVLSMANGCWSTREPFWRRIEKMAPEKRAILKELKSDDIKDHIWMFRT